MKQTVGKRSKSDIEARDRFLETGKVPIGFAITRGMLSAIRDPWLTAIKYMTGPLGFKLRQLYWANKLAYSGKGVLFDPDVSLTGPENISIGDFSYLAKGAQWYSPEGFIKIGERCHIGGRILGHGGVEIGDYVGSAGIILSATDSHQGGYRMSGPMIPEEQRRVRKAKVVISKDAFIGQFSIVMPGVTVGEGAIVAPHSLVVTDVPPWTVVKGSPAVVFSKRKKVKFSDV
ncbi:MAG: hypothetical protein AB7F23_07895 [Phycisphaerae bacterium]